MIMALLGVLIDFAATGMRVKMAIMIAKTLVPILLVGVFIGWLLGVIF